MSAPLSLIISALNPPPGATTIAVPNHRMARRSIPTSPSSSKWNEIRKGVFRPKEENWLSDYVAVYLRRDFAGRGVVIGREVEIRRGQGDGTGERTDILVHAVAPGSNDRVTVIIEVKGCWHRELGTAMQDQLRDRYLREIDCRHGLYLVGWYQCQWWDENHPPKKAAAFATLDEMRDALERQAGVLSLPSITLKAVTLDARLR
jgi:hypothetical protein